MNLNKNTKYILIGGGSHASTIMEIDNLDKKKVIGYTDKIKTNLKLKYIGNDHFFLKKNKLKNIKLIMAIGSNVYLRSLLFNKYKKKRYFFETLIDKSAIVSRSSSIGEGSIILKNTIIGSSVKIMENICVHNGSIIEHNSIVKKNSYISPGCVICGNCIIGLNVFLGAKSCLIENINIPNFSIVGAGAVVIKNQKKKNKKYLGVPAKIL